MTTIHRLQYAVKKQFDTYYILRFVFRLLGLYVFFRLVNWLMIGAIVPSGFYSPFIDQYLNYINFIKISVLQTGSWIAQLFGVESHLDGVSQLQIVGSKRLLMAWGCCGLELMSFWAAFALADTTTLRTKLAWCFGGLFFIWFINAARVGILAVAIKSNWPQFKTVDHHGIYNIAAFCFVFLMMFVYYKKNKMKLGL